MNPQVELAKRRNQIAADRTLLSWTRTSLTLIGIGFGTESVVEVIVGENDAAADLILFANLLGLALVALGTYAICVAAVDYHRDITKLQQEQYLFTPRHSLGTTVGIVVIALASVALVKVLLKGDV